MSNVYSKDLYTFEGLQPKLQHIIQTVHGVDTVHTIINKKGKPETVTIKKIKNLVKVYPKYVYAIHYLLTKALHQPQTYKAGVPLSRNEFAKRTCSKRPVASLIINTLVDVGIIQRIKKHSFNNATNQKHSSTYKFTEEFESLIGESATTKETFTSNIHGKMVKVLCGVDERYLQSQQEQTSEVGEPVVEIPTPAPVRTAVVTFNSFLDDINAACETAPVLNTEEFENLNTTMEQQETKYTINSVEDLLAATTFAPDEPETIQQNTPTEPTAVEITEDKPQDIQTPSPEPDVQKTPEKSFKIDQDKVDTYFNQVLMNVTVHHWTTKRIIESKLHDFIMRDKRLNVEQSVELSDRVREYMSRYQLPALPAPPPYQYKESA